MTLPDEIRSACARVAGEARRVRIVDEAIDSYARTFPAEAPRSSDPVGETAEEQATHILTLNAINFGSGWFPTLRKAPGVSGFRTVEEGLRAHGPWSAAALGSISAADVAHALGQDPGHELMGLFATHLRDLGRRVEGEHGGSFLALARSGEGSAVRLAERLAGWPTWRDVSTYGGSRVPFFKRAQIVAADLALAGVAPARDLERLTMFADNLVPHVLRVDGVLDFDPALVARIEDGR